MLRNDSLNSKEESNSSNIKVSSKHLDIDNGDIENTENSIVGSTSLTNDNDIYDNKDNEEIHNSTQKIKSCSSKQSSISKSYSKSNSYVSDVSKSQNTNKNSYLYEDNEIVKKVNEQIKASIDNHPDFLSHFIFTNKSNIGINKNDVFNEPKFPKEEEAPIWKIDRQLNDKTKIFLEALDCYEPLSSIFTSETLELNGKDNYGHYSIFIRETIYQNEPCYYVCVDLKIYDRTTSKTLVDKVTIAYVTTTLHTLNQTTREYLGKCEDQNNKDHYILTKFRILNYKTDKQKFIYSIYDENYYKENSKTIIAPHLLTEGGEEVVCRILGLILDEDAKDPIFDNTEFISLINDELKLVRFTLTIDNKYFSNGLEKNKIKEINEEVKYNKYLKDISELHEIDEIKKQIDHMKLEHSWNMSKSFDYLDVPKKIDELQNLIEQKQNEIMNKKKEEEVYLNQIKFDDENVLVINNVSSIKKTYVTIKRNKFFINVTEENKSYSSSSSSSSLSSAVPERIHSVFNKSVIDSYDENSYSSLNDKNNDDDNPNKKNDNIILDKIDTISLNNSKIIDDNQINKVKSIEELKNSIDLQNKENFNSKNNLTSIDKLNNSLSKIFTDKSASIHSIKDNNNNDVSKSQTIQNLNDKQSITKSLKSIPSKIGSINNSTTVLNNQEIKEDIKENSNSMNDKTVENNDNSNNKNENNKTTTTVETTETSTDAKITSNYETNETHNITNTQNNETTTIIETTEKTETFNNTNVIKMETTTTIETTEIYNNASNRNNSNIEIIKSSNSKDSLKNSLSIIPSLDPMSNIASVSVFDTTRSINIENITDEDIENEIMKMENGSNTLLSINIDNSKDLSSVKDIKDNLPISTISSLPVSTINSITNTPGISVPNSAPNSIPNSMPNSMPNSSISLTNSISEGEEEPYVDPNAEEIKRLYDLDIPQTLIYPYVEYDYIHQKGYLQIYCSKWQASFNSNHINIKGNKKLSNENDHLLDSPDTKSEYLSVKDKIKSQYTKYLNNNPHLKKVISDYLQLVLSRKPKDVYEFTKNYFNNETD
ncbi:hypothetical protein PIROE2DRAFT_15545 [Piromyces sp. E2]|nr:hypothetical protein PIROE2DRAFT_15545 [Piromyces sp. E2]|eukprot:OUM59031.1 hypothetical protein PIROE2DRAFT_15545 [Piromyces sp. E2]